MSIKELYFELRICSYGKESKHLNVKLNSTGQLFVQMSQSLTPTGSCFVSTQDTLISGYVVSILSASPCAVSYVLSSSRPVYQNCFERQAVIYIYRVSQEEWARLRESVPCVKLYRYNPKHLCPKSNGYGDNGKRKVWTSLVSTYCTPSVTSLLSNAPARSTRHGNAVTVACALQHGSSDVTR